MQQTISPSSLPLDYHLGVVQSGSVRYLKLTDGNMLNEARNPAAALMLLIHLEYSTPIVTLVEIPKT